MDKDFYNKSSAQSLGWDPTWFGEKYFDDKLVRAIMTTQRDLKEMSSCLSITGTLACPLHNAKKF
jgi:hypothetical protein